MLHGGFLLFNSAYVSHARSLVQKRSQLVQLIGRAGGVDLNPAIVFISDPAAHSDLDRLVLYEETKSNTLYAPRDKPSARCFRLSRDRRLLPGRHSCFQPADSPRPADAASLRTS